MDALPHLRRAAVQKVFLTATLPPNHEKMLAESVGISLSQSLVLRSPTARPNHSLQFAGVTRADGDLFTVGLKLASLLLTKWEQDPLVRGIIFVRSIKKADSLTSSAPFPVCKYHGSMSDQDKELHLRQWLSCESPEKWIIATTALLHGVDYARVDAVVFLESPYGLYDFVQGGGRAGRTGQPALVAVLHKVPLPYVLQKDDECTYAQEMRTVIASSTCRRLSVSQLMDGLPTNCAQLPGSLLCDICEERTDPLIADAIVSSRPTNAMTTAPSNTVCPPPPTPATTTVFDNTVRHPPPTPPSTALFGGKAAQVHHQSRLDHAQNVKELVARLSGCFTCRIVADKYRPCHDTCQSSGISTCSVSAHLPFSCTLLSHRSGWIDWKKSFKWPSGTRRCYFCGLPKSVLTTGQHRSELSPLVKCRYADSMVTAAWHVLNTPLLLQDLQRDLGFAPGPDVSRTFAVWLMEYGSESREINLLSVFSWVCRRFYPSLSINL